MTIGSVIGLIVGILIFVGGTVYGLLRMKPEGKAKEE
jgi:hypothetical protein